MQVLVLLPTTGALNQIVRLTGRSALKASFVVKRGDYRPLAVSKDYDALTSEAGPLAALGPLVTTGPHELRVSGEFDSGKSWELPVVVAHLAVALGAELVDDPAAAELILWATGAVDLDLGVVAQNYSLPAKLALSKDMFQAGARAGARIQVFLPPDSDPAPFEAILADAGAANANVAVIDHVSNARDWLQATLAPPVTSRRQRAEVAASNEPREERQEHGAPFWQRVLVTTGIITVWLAGVAVSMERGWIPTPAIVGSMFARGVSSGDIPTPLPQRDLAEAKPAEAKPVEAKLGEVAPVDAAPVVAAPKSEPVDVRPVDAVADKPADRGDAKPADTAAARPADPVDARPIDAVAEKPADPAEGKPPEPADDKQPANLPSEKPQDVAADKPASSSDGKSDEALAAERKPVEDAATKAVESPHLPAAERDDPTLVPKRSDEEPPAEAPVRVAAITPVHVSELRAPRGGSCFSVLFERIPPRELEVPLDAPDRFRDSIGQDLCGLEVTLVPDAGAVGFDVDISFERLGFRAVPTGPSGRRTKFKVEFTRQFSHTIVYNLNVSLARAAGEQETRKLRHRIIGRSQ